MAIEIDEKDRVRINAFLVSNAGRTLMAWLREAEQRPKIREDAQPHEVQIDAGKQLGYDLCIKKVESFVRPHRPTPANDGSPSLRPINRTVTRP